MYIYKFLIQILKLSILMGCKIKSDNNVLRKIQKFMP